MCAYMSTLTCIYIYMHTHIHIYIYIYIWWGGGAPEISANLSKGGTYLAVCLVERVLTLCYLDCHLQPHLPSGAGYRNKQDGLGLGKISSSILTPFCCFSDANTASPPAGGCTGGPPCSWGFEGWSQAALTGHWVCCSSPVPSCV